MRTIRLLCLAFILVAAPASAVAPPPRPLLGMEIEKLIQQLGDRNFALRDQAERRIRAEGLPALPYLRKAIGHQDPEIRRRALRMVPGLEHTALVAPKRITMSVRNQTIANVLAEVSKQSGYKVLSADNNNGFVPGVAVARPKGATEKVYSFTFVNVPFWDVIDKICRDTNMVVNGNWGDEAIRLQTATGHSVHAGRDGAFRYSAMNLQLNRNIDLSTSNSATTAENRSDNLTFGFQVFAEPRLPFLSMGEIRIDAAYDSEKNSMLVPVVDETNPNNFNAVRFGRRYYGGGGNKQMTMQANVSLQRTSQKATTIKELRGVLPVSLLVEQKPMPIAEKILTAKGKKSTIGDLEFSVETVTKSKNGFEIKFSIANKGNLNDYSWMNNIYQRLELVDAKGEKFQVVNTNWHGSNNNSVTMTLTYSANGRKMGDPDRFVFQHWITRQHDINFVFREVPLP